MAFVSITPPNTNLTLPAQVADVARQASAALQSLEEQFRTVVVTSAPSGTAGAGTESVGAEYVQTRLADDSSRYVAFYKRLLDTSNPPASQWRKIWSRPITETASNDDLWAYDSTSAEWIPQSSTTLGLVTGAASSTDNAVVRWDGATGLDIQNSGVIVDDSDNVTGVTSLSIDGTGTVLTVTQGVSLFNTSTALTGTFGAAQVQVDKTTGGTMLLHRESANSSGPNLEFLKRRSAWGVVSSGDVIGTLAWGAADSVDASEVGRIRMVIDGTPGSNDTPGRMEFYTTADAAGTATLRYTMDSAGVFFGASGAVIGTSKSAGNTLLLSAYDVDGAAYTTFATLTANDTPTFDLGDAVTKAGAYIYRAGGTDVATADGGTNNGSWTAGSMVFVGAGGTALAEDNNNFFWDNTNKWLAITDSNGTNTTPRAPLDVQRYANITPPTLDSSTVIYAQSAAFAGTSCVVQLLSGNTGNCFINFGDTDDINIGQFGYNHNTNTFSVTVNNATQFQIDSNGLGQFNQGLTVLEATIGDQVLLLTSTATNDDPNLTVTQGRAATTDATVTTLQTIAITASRTYQIEARVVARRTGGTAGTADDGASYVIHGSYTTKAGTVTLLGALSATYTAEDQAAWDATLTISGANVLVRVTGALDNNVVWHSTTYVSYVGT